ncbi:MAG: DUF4886 domain-containing protein [Clostridia bacterium]|nr:DUF4886 domain-containing protein [Clostridia bacterium]
MKFLKVILCTLLVFVFLCSCISVTALTDVSELGKKDTLKILAIGNSFSEDATEFIPVIAKDLGIKNIVVGNMYIGGCTIQKHAENARNNKAEYKYYKNTSYSLMSVCPTTQNVSLETALKDEEWDVVTLQDSSVKSGILGKTYSDLDYMINYVKTMCPNAKLGWHMTWAYETGYTGSAFKNNYKNDEMYMYNCIVDCVKEYIVPDERIDFIIPSGTAIQNARTSFLGDKLTRDGLHLTLDYGRYIVAATWMQGMGFSLDSLKTMPTRVRSRVLPFIRECVDNAYANPFTVTQSVHWYEPGTTPPATEPPVTEADTEQISTEPINTVQQTENMTQPEGSTTSPEDNGAEPEQEDNDNGSGSAVIVILIAATVIVILSVTAFVIKKKKK